MSRRGPESVYPPSPVPSDARLWPCELPFTAFGHLGDDKLDLRVFDQDVYWVDRLGVGHRLEVMSREYVQNVVTFLVDIREQYFRATQRPWFIQILGDQFLYGEPGADVLGLGLGGPSWGDLTAEEWLESTPLMRSLRRRLSGPDTT